MIKRNAKIITTDEGCQAIETEKQSPVEEVPKKRGGLFGFLGVK